MPQLLHLAGQDPLATRINFGWGGGAWTEVVGVVGEAKEVDLESAPLPTVYVPVAQRPSLLRSMSFGLAVRTRLDPATAIRPVRDVIHSLDPSQIIEKMRTMDAVVDEEITRLEPDIAKPGGLVHQLLRLDEQSLALGWVVLGVSLVECVDQPRHRIRREIQGEPPP